MDSDQCSSAVSISRFMIGQSCHVDIIPAEDLDAGHQAHNVHCALCTPLQARVCCQALEVTGSGGL